jgi:hypothetical protein
LLVIRPSIPFVGGLLSGSDSKIPISRLPGCEIQLLSEGHAALREIVAEA